MAKSPYLLIAEDDPALSAILEEYLLEYGYQVTIASRGDTALSLLEKQHFDIILSDIVMPGAGGLDILAACSSEPIKTLVILMTGYSGVEDAIHAVEQGAYDFVSKPFQLPEMKVRIDNAARYQLLLRKYTHYQTYGNRDIDHAVGTQSLSAPKSNIVLKAYHKGMSTHHV